MSARISDLLATAVAPLGWGSAYFVATRLLPDYPPMRVALLR